MYMYLNGYMDTWVNKLVREWIQWYLDEYMGSQMNTLLPGRIRRYLYGCIHVCTSMDI